jgi:MoxR-like ATPase
MTTTPADANVRSGPKGECKTFSEHVLGLDTSVSPAEDVLRTGLRVLLAQLDARVKGQHHVNRRLVQLAVLNGNGLIEGPPGEGKTTGVLHFAQFVGYRSRRFQGAPDTVPGDLTGSRMLTLVRGQPAMAWRQGPLFTTVAISDEINRMPPKAQAAALQAMQEKQVSLVDQPAPMTVYHDDDRRELASLYDRGAACFGVPVPDPDDPGRAPYMFLATQNPIEMEGTFPLPEAQLDRFWVKVIVHPAPIGVYGDIVRVNLLRRAAARAAPEPPPRRSPAPSPAPPPGPTGPLATGAAPASHPGELPLWVRTACFFESLCDRLTDPDKGPLAALVRGDGSGPGVAAATARPGLFDRLRLVIQLTHYRQETSDFMDDDEDGDGIDDVAGGADDPGDEGWFAAWERDPHQRQIREYLDKWRRAGTAPELYAAVEDLLTRPMFRYVESGVSPRALLSWLPLAAVEAFMSGSPGIRRAHLRAVAEDVLLHRVRRPPRPGPTAIPPPT